MKTAKQIHAADKEWTQERILADFQKVSGIDCVALSEAINASIATEREKLEAKWKASMVDVTTALQGYEKQLAAERHKVEILTRENDGRDQREAEYAQKMVAEIQARDKLLADERDKRSYSRLHVDLAESRRDNEQLREQLEALQPLVGLLREAHKRLGDTAFPSLSARIVAALAKVKEVK